MQNALEKDLYAKIPIPAEEWGLLGCLNDRDAQLVTDVVRHGIRAFLVFHSVASADE